MSMHIYIAMIAAFMSGGMFFHSVYMRRWFDVLFLCAPTLACAVYFAARSQGWEA